MAEFHIPLNIPDVEIVSQRTNDKGEFVLKIKSTKTYTGCHKCGKPATMHYGTAPQITIRHLPVFDTPVYLVITPVRYKCDDCGATTTEQYDWRKEGKDITTGLSDYLLRRTVNSTVEDVGRKEHISVKTVVGIIDDRIGSEIDWNDFKSLGILGIDEISLKKGHADYVTVISTKNGENGELSILSVLDGRLKETVKEFLRTIPVELRRTIKTVCTDMYDGYVNAVTETLGKQVLVVDRFHVAKLYREPLDKLRTQEMARLKTELSVEEYGKLEGIMWILRQKHECLDKADKEKLALLYKHSPLLKQAHSYALQLTHIFNTHCSRKSAMAKLDRWLSKIKTFNVTCYKNFCKTLEKYKPYIGNYFKERRSSGFVEGLNNRIKVIKRRCYGIFNPVTLFQRLYLDLQGARIYE